MDIRVINTKSENIRYNQVPLIITLFWVPSFNIEQTI